jgi:Acyl-CoA reductase (LuxC)
MMKKNTTEKINNLGKLNHVINESRSSGELQEVIESAVIQNSWFTEKDVESALGAIQEHLLSEDKLISFIAPYDINTLSPKRIGLILAGNIPMVGIHDIIMVYLSGHIALIKYSDKDRVLIQWLLKKLEEIDSDAKDFFIEVERLNDIDAVIATGSDNSSRYFDAYFGKYPNIIRKNRNSIAILSKNISDDDLRLLTYDILSYFGLGCRNVSKVYFEHGFDIDRLLRILDENNEVMHHNKYRNNYDYNLSLFLLNKKKFLQNGTTLLVEDKSLTSRIATLHYEWYDDVRSLEEKLDKIIEKIQCIVTDVKLEKLSYFNFGQSQCPAINDFADGVDTMEFLLKV